MGLFSSDESETDVPDERVKELVNNAQSDTVTEERLTQTDTSGIIQRGVDLKDKPLADYLNDGEQINYIVFNSLTNTKPIKVYDSDSILAIGEPVSSVVGITDERFIVLLSGISGLDGDVNISIPFSSIESFEVTGLVEAQTDADLSEDWPIILLQLTDSSVVNNLRDITNTNHGEFENSTSLKFILTDGMDDMERIADYLSAFAAKRERNIDRQTDTSDNGGGLGPLFDEEPDESAGDEEEEVNNSALQESQSEVLEVEFYNTDSDIVQTFPNDGTYPVSLTANSISIKNKSGGGIGYNIQCDEITDIEDYEHTHMLKKERMTKAEGIELVLVDGTHIALYKEETNDASGKFWGSSRASPPEVDFPKELEERIRAKSNTAENDKDAKYILEGPFDRRSIYVVDVGGVSGTTNYNCEMKVEGWTDGSSNINADISANSQEKGKSRGVQVGPFTRSKTTSKSSIEGEISGGMSDNTYSSNVKALKVYQERLVIDSKIKLDLHYSEIENIFPESSGIVVEVGSTTFRVENVSNSGEVEEAVAFVKEQMETFAEKESTSDDGEESIDSADKLRELKELHEDGILTDEEFQSKKEELLDDF